MNGMRTNMKVSILNTLKIGEVRTSAERLSMETLRYPVNSPSRPCQSGNMYVPTRKARHTCVDGIDDQQVDHGVGSKGVLC